MVRVKVLLGALTFCIALLGYATLEPYLGPFARWFFPVTLLLGLYLRREKGGTAARFITPLAIVLFLYFATGFTLERLVPITSDLLILFLGIRMLGEPSGRHSLQVCALSLFCLAASSLYDLSALFVVYLLLELLLLAVTLVLLTFHAHDGQLALQKKEVKKVLGVSLLMPVLSLPILLFLFVFLPRTPYPLWNYLNRSPSVGTGLSDQVNPGGFSSVGEVKGVVLRAICDRLPESALYWRGIVLNGFAGNAWVRLPPPRERVGEVERGVGVHQEIYPEPTPLPYLLALNMPRSLSAPGVQRGWDRVFTARRPLDRRIKYQAESTLFGGIAAQGGIDRTFYLRLPERVSKRVRAKGGELARSGLSAPEKLRFLERFFRGQRLAYATARLPTGPDPLDDFLFVAKRGNCEFFASSLAILLRLAGVPARLVGGYRGGSYNEVGGYYLVTQDMAHVWVEAYLEGEGWLCVDPTSWSTGVPNRGGGALRMYLDAVGFFWNKTVVTYDLEKQLALFKRGESQARHLQLGPVGFRTLLLWSVLPLLLFLMLLYRSRSRNREERLLGRFLRRVRRRYPQLVVENRGLFELAREVDDAQIREFVEIYGVALYRDRRLAPEEWARLKKLVWQFGLHRP